VIQELVDHKKRRHGAPCVSRAKSGLRARRRGEMSRMRPDVRRQEIEESAHPRRQMPALPDIDGVQRFLVAGVEILEHRH
jgi:hypothetical protein